MKIARILGLVVLAFTCSRLLSAQQEATLRKQTLQNPTAQNPATRSPTIRNPTTQNSGLKVAFTFDDLPAHGPLPPGEFRPAPIRSIIKTLKAEKMPPIYGFVNGFRVAEYPYQIELLREWMASGNPLGSHTWSHPQLDRMSAKKYIHNIAEDDPILRKLTKGYSGVDPRGDWHWFRYPYLEEGDTLAKRAAVADYLKANGYRTAEVTIDFGDYLWNDAYARCAARDDRTAIASLRESYLATAAEYIAYSRTISQRLYGRDIPYVLLLHVGAFDAKMLPELIALFRGKGFQFVTLPEAESDPAYKIDPKVAYPGGGLLLELQATARKVDTPDANEPEAALAKMCR